MRHEAGEEGRGIQSGASRRVSGFIAKTEQRKMRRPEANAVGTEWRCQLGGNENRRRVQLRTWSLDRVVSLARRRPHNSRRPGRPAALLHCEEIVRNETTTTTTGERPTERPIGPANCATPLLRSSCAAHDDCRPRFALRSYVMYTSLALLRIRAAAAAAAAAVATAVAAGIAFISIWTSFSAPVGKHESCTTSGTRLRDLIRKPAETELWPTTANAALI